MNKTVKVSGLQTVLDKLAPFVKAIAGGTVQLADGITLNIPNDTTLAFSATDDRDITRVEFGGFTATVDARALLGLFHVHGTDPVTYAAVGPRSIETQLSMFRVTAVDDGGERE